MSNAFVTPVGGWKCRHCNSQETFATAQKLGAHCRIEHPEKSKRLQRLEKLGLPPKPRQKVTAIAFNEADTSAQQYFLQRHDDPLVFEQVDGFLWANWAYAKKQNEQRYTGLGYKVADAGALEPLFQFQIPSGTCLTKPELAVIMRVMNVKVTDAPEKKEYGFVQAPEYVKLILGGIAKIHELNGSQCDLT